MVFCRDLVKGSKGVIYQKSMTFEAFKKFLVCRLQVFFGKQQK